jgi:hypothetical protein
MQEKKKFPYNPMHNTSKYAVILSLTSPEALHFAITEYSHYSSTFSA